MHITQLLGTAVTGTGPATVVFGNGFATTQRSWDTLVASLPPGWRIIRFDYVGSTPQSAPAWIPERYRQYEGHADDLVRLLTALDVQRSVFVGHSMSGMIGALASLRAPERFAHLFLIGASACYRRDGPYDGGFTGEQIDEVLRAVDADLEAWMGGFGPIAMGADATALMLADYLATVRAMRPDIGRTMLRAIFTSDYRAVLPNVTTPATIVQMSRDVAVPVSAGAFLARTLRSTGLHLLDIAGHLPHITHPQLVLPLLHDVLARHLDDPSRGATRDTDAT